MAHSSRSRLLPSALLTCAAILLSCSGCATSWARGIVRNEAGQQVSAAEIVVSPLGEEVGGARGVSESNGCFNVLTSAKKEQSEFVLIVAAPGYKPVSAHFRKEDRFTALVTLAPESGPGDGSVTRVADSEQSRVYEQPCIPPVDGAASSFGIR